MSDSAAPIYHLAPESELRSGLGAELYRPRGLAQDGFVHCADHGSVLAVANDFFAALEESLTVLEIDATKLSARWVYEAPAPLPSEGDSHLATAEEFPHVYGPIDRKAIRRIGVLRRGPQGFEWPQGFQA